MQYSKSEIAIGSPERFALKETINTLALTTDEKK